MATWKKVIVSGSAAELLNITASAADITTLNVTAGSGSFSGSFQGDGSGLTGISASGVVLSTLSDGLGIENFSYDGQSSQIVTLDTSSTHFTEGVREKITVADTTGATGINLSYDETTGTISGSLLDATTLLGNTTLTLQATASTVDGLTLTDVIATGSFSGSFVGTTDLPDLTESTGITAFTYDGSGTATIAVSGASALTSNTVTKWTGDAFADTTMTDDGTTVTVSNNLVVNNNLVVEGTASFQNTENLLVKDRFILLASGSTTSGDGGFIVQQNTQDVGEVFGFSNGGNNRWGIATGFDATGSVFSPDAFMAAVVVSASLDPDDAPAVYDRPGNIYVSEGDGSIYIYS
jgi:hypothetical protein